MLVPRRPERRRREVHMAMTGKKGRFGIADIIIILLVLALVG